MPDQRLNAYLAHFGYGTRRSCDLLITEGRVTVDGQIAPVGMRVNPELVTVLFDGAPLSLQTGDLRYYLFHKPKGSVVYGACTDPNLSLAHALAVAGIVATDLKVVGKLEPENEGALLCTNDGKVIHALTHPRVPIKQTFLVTLGAPIDAKSLSLLTAGIMSEGEMLHAGAVRPKGEEENQFLYEVDYYEGKTRMIERLFEALSLPILGAKRLQYANITLRDLPLGTYRPLEEREIRGLLAKGFESQQTKKRG